MTSPCCQQRFGTGLSSAISKAHCLPPFAPDVDSLQVLYSAAKEAGCDTAPGLVLLRGAAEGGAAAARGVRCAVLLIASPMSAHSTR